MRAFFFNVIILVLTLSTLTSNRGFAAANFTAANQTLKTSRAASLEFDNEMTACAWVYLNTLPSTSSRIFDHGTGGNSLRLMYLLSALRYGLDIVKTSTVASAYTTTADTTPLQTWMYLCATWSSASAPTLYKGLAGQSLRPVSVSPMHYSIRTAGSGSVSPVTGQAFALGNRDDGARSLAGRLAEVRIFDAVLTQAEMQSLMLGYPARPANLKAYWPLYMLDGAGSDASGNGANLTNINGVSRADHAPVAPAFGWFGGGVQ